MDARCSIGNPSAAPEARHNLAQRVSAGSRSHDSECRRHGTIPPKLTASHGNREARACV